MSFVEIIQLEIQVIAVIVAVACALPGVFLVLRKMALISDAISHSILFGIVLAYFLIMDLSSPILLIGAALTGLLVVILIELLKRTRLVREDAAIGLVFPALFSIGVLLISLFAGNVHLDIDIVLYGELVLAPTDRLSYNEYDLGPKILYVMGTILIINLLFITLFYKELKLSTFDMGLYTALGFSSIFINYGLVSIVSLTAVGAFDAVGSILVVALMIAPPATAYLITDRLSTMIIISALIGAISGIAGYWISHWINASIAGSITVMTGIFFLFAYFFSPQQGILIQAIKRFKNKEEFSLKLLLVHISNHQNTPEFHKECNREELYQHLHWESDYTQKMVRQAIKKHWVREENKLLYLTENGEVIAKKSIDAYFPAVN